MLPKGIVAAFSSRGTGNMSLFYGNTDNALLHRERFLRGAGVMHTDLVCAKQIHASTVRYVKEEDRGRGALSYEASVPDTDAFITDRKQVPLAIFTADCLSVFLFDPEVPAIGLVHAGWRSSKDRITAKTLAAMHEKFGTLPENILAGFGPSIRSCCYEVGSEFEAFFPEALVKRGGRSYLDLIGENRRQLIGAGIREANIFDPEICTSCRGVEFFSFRKEGKACGRMMSVMMLT